MRERQRAEREVDAAKAPPRRAPSAPAAGLVERALQLQSAAGNRALRSVVADDDSVVHAAATEGLRGRRVALPHADRIQASFGRHDVSGISAHVGGPARDAAEAMGADAYATGTSVAFARSPDLHTAAHEAAHVVQQRAGVHLSGGVGRHADRYERHADEVAGAVVEGRSSEALLDRVAGSGTAATAVQRYTRHKGAGPQKKTLRVSEAYDMAVQDSKTGEGGHDFWATDAIVNAAQGKLSAVGSPYALRTDAGATITLVDKRSKKAPKVTLKKVIARNNTNQTEGDLLKTIEACSAHGQDVMGASGDTSTGMAVVTSGGEERYDKRGMMGASRTDTEVLGSLREQMTGASGKEASTAAYPKMKGKDRKAAAQAAGVNQYADADVGEGLAVYRASGTVKKDQFPMHFAPVIARSGPDHVTLENWAKNASQRDKGDTSGSSAAWHYRMYGPMKDKEDQTFHGEHAADGGYGGEKNQMTLKHRKVQGFTTPDEVAPAEAAVKTAREGKMKYDLGMAEHKDFVLCIEKLGSAISGLKKTLSDNWVKGIPTDASTLLAVQAELEGYDEMKAIRAGKSPKKQPVGS